MSLHRFGEYVSYHIMSRCVDDGEVGLVSVSEEEISNVNVLRSLGCWFIVLDEVYR